MAISFIKRSSRAASNKFTGETANAVWNDGARVIDDRQERFRAAAREADRRYDAAVRLARTWKVFATGASVIAALAVLGFLYEAGQPDVKPLFVPYDSIGNPGKVFIPHATEPPDLMKIAHAEHLVKAMFTRSSDPNVNADNTNFVRTILRPDDARKAWETMVETEGRDNAEMARQIEIIQTMQRSPSTVSVKWRETEWKDGRATAQRIMSGDFTFRFVAPYQSGLISTNPAGLFCMQALWAEETPR